MGAWIEIWQYLIHSFTVPRRTPRWVRGLKSLEIEKWRGAVQSRTPRWVRGLKYQMSMCIISNRDVAPHDGCVD